MFGLALNLVGLRIRGPVGLGLKAYSLQDVGILGAGAEVLGRSSGDCVVLRKGSPVLFSLLLRRHIKKLGFYCVGRYAGSGFNAKKQKNPLNPNPKLLER